MAAEDFGEFELIERLIADLPAPSGRARVGPGDDGAIIDADAAAVVSVDAVVEDVHFRLPSFPLVAVGRKALAVALSDLAAMGADPGEAYVVLGLPEDRSGGDALELGNGIAEVARRHGVGIAGGDVTRAPCLLLSVTAIGYEPEASPLVTRSGAHGGDVAVVTGQLGAAAAALRLLDGGRQDRASPAAERILARQLDPAPRLEAGRALAAAGATSMIDLSDGIGGDAAHLARASGVRLEIQLERLPVQDGVAEIAGGDEQALELALSGGEDHELLATLPEQRLAEAGRAVDATGVSLTAVGRVVEGTGVAFLDAAGNERPARGFDQLR